MLLNQATRKMDVACVVSELLTVVTRGKIDIFYFTEFSPPLYCCYLSMQCEFRCKLYTSRTLSCIYNMFWCVCCNSMSCTHAVGTLCSISSILFQSSFQQTWELFLRHRPIDTCSLQAFFVFLVPEVKSLKAPLQGVVWTQFGWRLGCHKINTGRKWIRK